MNEQRPIPSRSSDDDSPLSLAPESTLVWTCYDAQQVLTAALADLLRQHGERQRIPCLYRSPPPWEDSAWQKESWSLVAWRISSPTEAMQVVRCLAFYRHRWPAPLRLVYLDAPLWPCAGPLQEAGAQILVSALTSLSEVASDMIALAPLMPRLRSHLLDGVDRLLP
ncbi:MAG: hypothetical protein KatS3mg111_0253 [Pirellulaceae bacterium]|nr:MAG: hypothetical protein KatS3mg111_0253 [Pirellulaceae bacterium]